MFSAALPVLLRVTVFELLLPTLTPPKATDEGLIVSCGCGAVPVPPKPIESGEPGALLVMETLPLALPATVGANVTVNELVPPGFKVLAAKPDTVKPAPETFAAETDTGAVPVFESVTDTEPLLPKRMLPKVMLLGLADSLPCVPVPLSAIESVGLEAFVEIVIVPETVPVVGGANVAVNEA